MEIVRKMLFIIFFISLCSCSKAKDYINVPVTNITFDHNRLTLSIGSTATLVAMVSPKETSDKTMVWSSSDESIVQINSATGLMEAVKEGAAIITCTTKQSDLKASCDVVVLPILNILFVGNSFTYDAVRWLPGLLRGAGVKNVNMVLMYRSGSLIKEHVSDYESDIGYTCYRAVPGAPGWVSTTGYSIKDVIDERKWNVVSIQEHTENAEAWGLTPQRQDVIQQWINMISADQKDRPEFAYIMTQAYGNPNIIPLSLVRAAMVNNFSSQDAMYSTIAAHGQKLMSETQIDRIIATGTAIQNLRTSSLNTPLDGWHIDQGLGSYTGACTVFESLIVSQLPGTTLEGNSFQISTRNNDLLGLRYTTPVTGENVSVAIETARHAVRKPFEVTSMSNEKNE